MAVPWTNGHRFLLDIKLSDNEMVGIHRYLNDNRYNDILSNFI